MTTTFGSKVAESFRVIVLDSAVCPGSQTEKPTKSPEHASINFRRYILSGGEDTPPEFGNMPNRFV